MEKIDVLFVDNEPHFLDSIRIIFGLKGISVCCISSGEEALDAIKEKRFKVIFTDMVMDGISGLEFAGIAKERLPGIPIYLLTGNIDSPELASLASQVGITEILTKPVSIELVLDIVTRLSEQERLIP